VIPLLLEVYRAALAWIGSWISNPSRLADPDEKLGEHVFMVYWRNMAGSEGEALLNAFSAAASAELRGHTLLTLRLSNVDRNSTGLVGGFRLGILRTTGLFHNC
jgi:hypothetical protein